MKIKTELKYILNATPGPVCDLVQFSSVFPFCAWLLPKSQWFNQQQAKLASVGRLWSHAGLVVWFRAMWTMECKKEPFILMCIPFICVTHAYPICVLRQEWTYAGACCASFCICCTCYVKLQWRQKNRESILFWQHDWSGHCFYLPRCVSALRHFYWFIIKSHHSPALLCLIHLWSSFNHCHTAPVFCSSNWLDLAINQTD